MYLLQNLMLLMFQFLCNYLLNFAISKWKVLISNPILSVRDIKMPTLLACNKIILTIMGNVFILRCPCYTLHVLTIIITINYA